MNVEELTKLENLLIADAANEKGMKFNLRFVAIPSDRGTARENGNEWDPELNCNQGCAMGLAAISNKFPRLTFEIMGNDMRLRVDGEPQSYDYAAVKLFDIPYDEARKLFSPDYYNTIHGAEAELAVAKRIRQLIVVGDLEDITDVN